jgi:hypothetical protein
MQKKPVGPCLLITPWNFPLAMVGVVVPGDDLDVVGQVRVQPKRGHVQPQGVWRTPPGILRSTRRGRRGGTAGQRSRCSRWS